MAKNQVTYRQFKKILECLGYANPENAMKEHLISRLWLEELKNP
jgi:hypothetical protein